MSELERVQVLIGTNQRRTLTRIARREGLSVSELLRELIERGLEQRTRAQPEWQSALVRLRQRRAKQTAHPRAKQSLLAQARRERTQELERAWKPS